MRLLAVLAAVMAAAHAPPPERFPDRVPEFTPDGRSVVFERLERVAISDLRGHVRAAPDDVIARSRDGRYELHASSGRIWVQNRNRTGRHLLPRLNAPEWSPDGRAIAFVHLPDSRLWVANGNGTDPRPLPVDLPLPPCADPCVDRDAEPHWSPDGSRLAFLYTRAPDQDVDAPSTLYVVPAGGGPAASVAGADHVCDLSERSYGWSANGAWFAFLAVREDVCSAGGATRLMLMHATGGAPLDVGVTGIFVWSPAGPYVAFQNKRGVFVASPSGIKRLFAGGRSFDWAPRGDRFVYVRGQAQLMVGSARTGRARTVAKGIAPEWSPRRGWIVFASLGCGPQQGLHLIRPDGTGDHRLTKLCFVLPSGTGPVHGTPWDDEIRSFGVPHQQISCGAGDDIVYADRTAVVARDCEHVYH